MDYLIPQPERQSFLDKLYKLFLEDWKGQGPNFL